MGTFYEFCCTSCEYKVIVAGGYDRGFEARLVTVTCPSCQVLMDVSLDTKLWGEAQMGLSEPEVKCKSGHDAQVWTDDACPVCQARMERVRFVMDWD